MRIRFPWQFSPQEYTAVYYGCMPVDNAQLPEDNSNWYIGPILTPPKLCKECRFHDKKNLCCIGLDTQERSAELPACQFGRI